MSAYQALEIEYCCDLCGHSVKKRFELPKSGEIFDPPHFHEFGFTEVPHVSGFSTSLFCTDHLTININDD